MSAVLGSGPAMSAHAAIEPQDPLVALIQRLGPPPPEPTTAENAAADDDIPFYNARIGLSNARSDKVCAELSKAKSPAETQAAIDRYFDRYFKDDTELLRKYPVHSHFIRDMDFKTHLLQTQAGPEFFRKACAAG
jgi:hypothetical protein